VPIPSTKSRTEIISELFTGKNFNDLIQKMEPERLREDLKQEVALILCEMPDEKFWEIRDLSFFTVRIVLNQVKSNTSPFARKYRQYTAGYVDNYDTKEIGEELKTGEIATNETFGARKQVLSSCIEDTEIKQRLIKEKVDEIALKDMNYLHWYDKEMLRLYIELGSFRKIEELTKIPYVSCYHNVKKSLDTIKRNAIKKAGALFSKEELSFIQNGKRK